MAGKHGEAVRETLFSVFSFRSPAMVKEIAERGVVERSTLERDDGQTNMETPCEPQTAYREVARSTMSECWPVRCRGG